MSGGHGAHRSWGGLLGSQSCPSQSRYGGLRDVLVPASPGGSPVPCPGLGSRLIPPHTGLLQDQMLLTHVLWGSLADLLSSCSPFCAALGGFPYMLQLAGESTKLNTLSRPELEMVEAKFKTSHRGCPSRHGAAHGTPRCRSLSD